MIFLFRLDYDKGWDKFFSKMDSSVQKMLWKRIQKLKTLEKARHLKRGLPYFVAEVEQYRIGFIEEKNIRTIAFVGNHKQYQRWYTVLEKL